MAQNLCSPVMNEIFDKYHDNESLKPRRDKNISTLPYF